MDSEFLTRGGGIWAPLFFDDAKFEVKNIFGIFLIDRMLWTLNFSKGLSGYQLFLVVLNLR